MLNYKKSHHDVCGTELAVSGKDILTFSEQVNICHQSIIYEDDLLFDSVLITK